MWARFSAALRSTSSRHGLEDQPQQQEQEQRRLSLNSLMTTTTTLKQSPGHPIQAFGLDITNHIGPRTNQVFGQDDTMAFHHPRRHKEEEAIPNSSLGRRSVDVDVTMNQSHTEVMNILTDISDINNDSSSLRNGGEDEFSMQPESILPPLPPIPSSFTQPNLPPPPSPPRRTLFKRGTHKDLDPVRGSSGSLKLLPKKIRGSLSFGNGIQQQQQQPSSHASPTVDSIHGPWSKPKHEPQDPLRSTGNHAVRRSCFDSPAIENRTHGSVRSILRDPKTPGTGQNVRFFSNDALKVMSPEESMEGAFFSPFSQVEEEEEGDGGGDGNGNGGLNRSAFVERLNRLGSSHTSTPISRVSSSPSSSPPIRYRPSLNGVFTPVESEGELMSFSGPVEPPDFNVNGSLDGDCRVVDSPLIDESVVDLDFLVTGVDSDDGKVTSTPFKPDTRNGNGKRMEKEKEESVIKEGEEREELLRQGEEEEKEKKSEWASTPGNVDETIFHSMERKPVFSPPLHERSQSFSFGQTVFRSVNKKTLSKTPNDKTDSLEKGFDSASFVMGGRGGERRHHHRASSDTVSQSILHAPSSSSPMSSKRDLVAPETDINNELSADFQIDTSATEPDPFNANANTYYTPQTMIPTTPPAGVRRQHVRKTSKEESLIYSLQAQLTLQTEICSQFEADLRAKDEMVELLGKRLVDMEKQEDQRKGAVRQWKKKVQELERAVRILEEEVDTSRQESMERSVMDEASSEALRMLHRQIAGLEKEKKDWEDKERVMKSEAETLEVLMQERLEEVVHLKEMLWKKDESEKELVNRLKEAREEIDTLGNVSLGGVDHDEEELRRLAEREEKVHEERRAYRVAEMDWEQEKAELVVKLESVQVENIQVEEQLDSLKQEFKTKNEEYDIMKNELEAQWRHTETASDKIRELQQAKKRVEEEIARTRREKEEVVQERDELAQRCDEAEQRVNHLEMDWNESENKKHELECELHELWDEKEDLEKERGQLEEKLSQERDRIGGLMNTVKQSDDRIAQLERECQTTSETIVRLENGIHQRDDEIGHHTERIRAQKIQVENLRDEIGDLKREYEHVVNDLDEHSRALREATELQSGTMHQLQDLLGQKADVDADLKSHQERNELLEMETERLKKHVYDMQQESADKEIKIVQLTKQHGQDKEDIQGLNIALDAKQQELELYKRKTGIKTSSNTSVPSSSSSSSALKNLHRRDSSSLFDGAPASARPPSRTASESGSNKGENFPGLGKSSRINMLNGTSTTGSAIKIGKREASVESVGHLPPPKRSSTSATPTLTYRPGTATSRVKSSTGMVPVRRVTGTLETRASVIGSTPSISEESSDKENVKSNESDETVRRSIVSVPL